MSIEKCQSCAYLNPVMYHCGKYLRGCETAIYLCQKENPHTNADRIRAMTDEELVAVLSCPLKKSPMECSPSIDCDKCIRDWLKQEIVKE